MTFSCPLPPAPLRSNSRHHWGTKVRAKQTYSRAVWGWWLVAHDVIPKNYRSDLPWSAAAVSYEWHYCGNAPDEGNLGANLKALQDILCMAPDNGLQENNTTYLGLVENDKHIIPTYSMVKEQRRAAERVEVRITRVQ